MFVASEYAACFLIMLALMGMLMIVYGLGCAVKAVVVRVIPAKYIHRRSVMFKSATPTVVDISL